MLAFEVLNSNCLFENWFEKIRHWLSKMAKGCQTTFVFFRQLCLTTNHKKWKKNERENKSRKTG